MKLSSWILGLALLVFAGTTAPLSAAKVQSFTGLKIDINGYRTFSFFKPKVLTKLGIVEDHPANPVLTELIGRELTARGLREVADNADLQIQAFVLTETTPQVEAVIIASVAVTPGDYMLIGDPIATIGRYNRSGSLYINLIDRVAKRSAWFGMTSDSLPTKALNPDDLRKKLDKATTNIFKKYPVQKKAQ